MKSSLPSMRIVELGGIGRLKLGRNWVPPVYFCVTVIALTLILGSFALILMRWFQKGQNQLLEILQTTTNLAASKELSTFHSLQAMNSVDPQSELESPPLGNDEAVAHHLAKQFEAHGMNPNLAYAPDDDLDAFKDFGL